MTFLQIYLISLLTILGVATLVWGLSLILKDASIVDIFWGAGFVSVGWLYLFLTPAEFTIRQALILLLITIWCKHHL